MKPFVRNPIALLVVLTVLGSILAGKVTAQTFTIIHTFTGSSTNVSGDYTINSDGIAPNGLTLSGNTLYGTASQGGSGGVGTLFAINSDGTEFTNLHVFSYGAGGGVGPLGTLLLSSNTLYGTTSGSGGAGTVFTLKTDGSGFVVLVDNTEFWRFGGALALSGNRLYGTDGFDDYAGGSGGEVFALNTDGTGFMSMYDEVLGHGVRTNSIGLYPSSLMLYSSILYGTTLFGGVNGNGTIFKLNADGTGFMTLYAFTATYPNSDGILTNSDGAGPRSLVLSNNTIYGVACGGGPCGGGAFGLGTVFKVNIDGTGFTTLHSFTGYNDGAYPYAGLVLKGNTLYGTASQGGSRGNGTVFALNTDGTGFTNLHVFTSTTYVNPWMWTNSDGEYPEAGLVLSGNTLYGTTRSGGTNGTGTIFSISLPPELSFTTSAENLVLSWPTNFTGYTLQQSIDLGSAGWTTYNLEAPRIISNGQFVVTVPNNPTNRQQFFRLSQ